MNMFKSTTGVILMNMFKSTFKRDVEYWKVAVEYHTRELAEQRRQLRRARAKLAQAEKEENELKEMPNVVQSS